MRAVLVPSDTTANDAASAGVYVAGSSSGSGSSSSSAYRYESYELPIQLLYCFANLWNL